MWKTTAYAILLGLSLLNAQGLLLAHAAEHLQPQDAHQHCVQCLHHQAQDDVHFSATVLRPNVALAYAPLPIETVHRGSTLPRIVLIRGPPQAL